MARDSMAYLKSKAFASRIIKMYMHLTEKKGERVLSKQVLRSGTSIGANLSEADWASSKADFLSKVNIAHKEAHETVYGLALLGENRFLTPKIYTLISSDCNELISMFVAPRKTLATRKD